MRFFAVILYAALIFVIYFLAENRLLIVRRYKIKTSLPKEMSPLKIVQISDVHGRTYGKNWKRLLFKVRSLSPDLILITGDLVSRTARDLSRTAVLLRGLCGICPVYCCLGNHELDLPDKVMEQYRKMMSECGAFLLEDEQEVFEKNGKRIFIAGASLKSGCYKNENGGYSKLQSVTPRELSESVGEKEGFTVLLAHNPFFYRAYARWGAELTFSGHVHGGAVRVPFLGGVLSPERKFFPKVSRGIYEEKGKKTIVSAGIGKYRLFNPPEILYAEIFSDSGN